jgi:hypothetical protein
MSFSPFALERTSEHFKSDSVAGSYQLAPSSGTDRHKKRDHEERRHRRQDRAAADDEDDEIRKAIELSKVTAQKEEEERLKEKALKSGKMK